jgi:1-acyl-sn-glycerol-3-phosphate acyltransferase
MADLWLPRSTCGPHCLPAAGRLRIGTTALVGWRLLATATVLLAATLALPVLATLPVHHLARARRAFARAVLRALGVRHSAAGRVPERHALLVANHVSWLDILVILAHTPARLLAKHEVRTWPLIGRLATALGTVFVDRTRPKTLPATVARVADGLAAGAVVAVFPEGTTWCGRSGGRFRPAMFQAAIAASVPVVPVRLTFTLDGAPTTVAAFLGDDTLFSSACRVMRANGLTVTLRAHPLLHPTQAEGSTPRRTLASAAATALLR